MESCRGPEESEEGVGVIIVHIVTENSKMLEHPYPYHPERYTKRNPSSNHPQTMFQLSGVYCIVSIVGSIVLVNISDPYRKPKTLNPNPQTLNRKPSTLGIPPPFKETQEDSAEGRGKLSPMIGDQRCLPDLTGTSRERPIPLNEDHDLGQNEWGLACRV